MAGYQPMIGAGEQDPMPEAASLDVALGQLNLAHCPIVTEFVVRGENSASVPEPAREEIPIYSASPPLIDSNLLEELLSRLAPPVSLAPIVFQEHYNYVPTAGAVNVATASFQASHSWKAELERLARPTDPFPSPQISSVLAGFQDMGSNPAAEAEIVRSYEAEQKARRDTDALNAHVWRAYQAAHPEAADTGAEAKLAPF